MKSIHLRQHVVKYTYHTWNLWVWVIHFICGVLVLADCFFFCWVISPLSTVTAAAFGRGLLTRIRCCTGMQRLMQGRSDTSCRFKEKRRNVVSTSGLLVCFFEVQKNILMIKMSCVCSNEFGKRKITFHCSPCSLHVCIAAILLGNIATYFTL